MRRLTGSQYVWLAQVCRDLSFEPGSVELGLVRHDPPTEVQQAIFDDPHAPAPVLRTEAARTLFGSYSFPLLGFRKTDIQSEAAKMGWTKILDATWFCHRPIMGKPCGCCSPCKVARTERPETSFSQLGHLRNAFQKVRHRLAKV